MRKKKTSKLLHEPAILVKKRKLKTALEVISEVLQIMGSEFQELRETRHLDPVVKKTLMQIVSAHIQNVSAINIALAECWFEDSFDKTKSQQEN